MRPALYNILVQNETKKIPIPLALLLHLNAVGHRILWCTLKKNQLQLALECTPIDHLIRFMKNNKEEEEVQSSNVIQLDEVKQTKNNAQKPYVNHNQ